MHDQETVEAAAAAATEEVPPAEAENDKQAKPSHLRSV
jgi:hypothetical protein